MAAKLIQRPTYLERALMFRDTDLVKVITGVRQGSYPSDIDGIRIVRAVDFFLG